MDLKHLNRTKEDITCSFESAKKLKENNIKLDTVFSWFRRGKQDDSVRLIFGDDVKRYSTLIMGEWFSAPTTGELDHILHVFGFTVILTDSQFYDLNNVPEEGFWYDLACLDDSWDFTLSLINTNSVDAKVDALIWLCKEGIVSSSGRNNNVK